MRVWIAGLICAVVVMSGAAGAQGCELPDVSAYWQPGTPDREQRELAVQLQDYQLCQLEAFAKNPKRRKFPGDEAMIASFRKSIQQNRDLFAKRSSFPGAAVILERALADKKMQAAAGGFATYQDLSRDIYLAETCDVNECLGEVLLDEYRSQGKDPYADAARFAREARGASLEPWFLLGNLTIKRETNDLTGLRLRQAFDEAIERHNTLLAELSNVRAALNEVIKTRNGIMQPLEADQRVRTNALNGILAQYQIDPAQVRASDAHKGFTARIAKADRRMLQLDKAITHLFATRGDTQEGQDLIRGLQDEREAVEVKAETARQDREMLFSPDLPLDVAAKVKVMRREVDDGQADINRRKRIYSARTDRAEAKVYSVIAALDKAAEQRNAARKAYGNYTDNLRLMRVIRVTTDHATLVEATEEEIERFRKHLDGVRREVRARRAALPELDVRRDETRKAMLEAGDRANEANIALRNSGFVSYIAQASIEVAFAAYDLAQAYKVGPAGFFTEATKQIVMGVAYPPSYYDAGSYTLSEYALGQSAPRSSELVDIDKNLSGAPAAKTLEKNFRSMPFKVILKALEESAAKSSVGAARDSYISAVLSATTSETIQREFLEEAWKQEARLGEISKELAKMTGAAGKGKFAAQASLKIGKDLLKGVAKEAAKKGIAEVIEGGYLEDYMLAQLELAQAVVERRHATHGEDDWRTRVLEAHLGLPPFQGIPNAEALANAQATLAAVSREVTPDAPRVRRLAESIDAGLSASELEL